MTTVGGIELQGVLWKEFQLCIEAHVQNTWYLKYIL